MIRVKWNAGAACKEPNIDQSCLHWEMLMCSSGRVDGNKSRPIAVYCWVSINPDILMHTIMKKNI